MRMRRWRPRSRRAPARVAHRRDDRRARRRWAGSPIAFAKRVAIAPGLRLGFAAVLAAGAVGCHPASRWLAAGGPVSALEEIRSRFEAEPASGPGLNNRLFSISGAGRAETIRVAWDSATENPVVGTGAGTFEIGLVRAHGRLRMRSRRAFPLRRDVQRAGLRGSHASRARPDRPLVAAVRAGATLAVRRARMLAPISPGSSRAASTGTGRWSA